MREQGGESEQKRISTRGFRSINTRFDKYKRLNCYQ